MKVLCVANHKGGVGKTTTSINIAAGLAKRGKRTLLIDLDAQGNSSVGLGINTDNVYTLSDLLLQEEVKVEDVIQHTAIENLDIIPSDLSLSTAEVRISAEGGKDYQLRRYVENLKNYDFVILDCPPNFGTMTINAFTTASKVLMPVELDYFNLKSLYSFLDLLNHVRKKVTPVVKHDIDIFGILITSFDPRTNLSKEVLSSIEESFPKKLMETRIPINVKLKEAQAAHKSIFDYDSTSKGAEAYKNAVTELLERGL